MNKELALAIAKNELKKPVINEFVDGLGIEDAEFRDLLREYLHPHLSSFIFGDESYKQTLLPVDLVTEVRTKGHYNDICAKLVSIITGTTASELTLLQLCLAMKKEFEAFKTEFNSYKNFDHNGNKLWLQFMRYDLLRQHMCVVITNNDWDHTPTTEEFVAASVTIEDEAEPQGVGLNVFRKKKYDLTCLTTVCEEEIGGCFQYFEDMIKHMDIVIKHLLATLETNKLEHYKAFLDHLEWDHERYRDTMTRMAVGLFALKLKEIDDETRLDSHTEYTTDRLREIEDKIKKHDLVVAEIDAYTSTLPVDDTFQGYINRFLKAGVSHVTKADGSLYGEASNFAELLDDIVTYVTGDAECSFQTLKTTLCQELVLLQTKLEQFKHQEISGAELFIQYVRYQAFHLVFGDTYEDRIRNHYGHISMDLVSEAFDAHKDAFNYTKNDSLLETMEECISYIETELEWRKLLYSLTDTELSEQNAGTHGLASDNISLTGVDLTFAVRKISVPLYKYDNDVKDRHITVEKAMKEHRKMKENKRDPEKIKAAIARYEENMRQADAYIDELCIKDETYREAVRKFIKSCSPRPINEDGVSVGEDGLYEEAVETIATYVIDKPLGSTPSEQLTTLHEIETREYDTLKDVFKCYQAGTASGTALLLQFIRFSVSSNKLEDAMMSNGDYETLSHKDIDALNIKCNKFDLNTRQGCIDNISENFAILDAFKPLITKAIYTMDKALLNAIVCRYGLFVLNTGYPMEHIRKLFQ